MIEISANKRQLKALGAELDRLNRGGESGLKGQVASAINRATKKTLSATSQPEGMSQVVRKHLNIKAAQMRKEMKVYGKATGSNLTNRVRVMFKPRTSLIHFGARKTAKGVSYKIETKGGTKKINGPVFIGTGPRGGKQVFRRVARKKKVNIIKLYGVSIWGYLEENNLAREFSVLSGKRLKMELDEQIKKVRQRWGKK